MILPTLNEAPNVAGAIASARAIDCPQAPLAEVIVADGGSDDGTTDRAQAAGATVINAPRGRGRQLRAGIARATGDVLLMLHADNRLPPTAGEQIARALTNPRVVCGAFRQRIDATGFGYRLLEQGNAFRAGWLGLPYGDQAIFLRREALEALGGVPPLPLLEEIALMQRFGRQRRERGYGRPVLVPGPLLVSARRWQQTGVVRQTLRNWGILSAFLLGTPAERLVAWYAPPNSPAEERGESLPPAT
ncbi:TIGR04283 family arsenosugar biosynthesis glycosyltransferase [Botrimarina hoheduenensis]|uniref:Glycosyl transferase family 2 n=1 Tax=Botrimarina hoheduenensis TaxID=2528000 RepID=A0A5C5VVH1_9BACT|nr:TIGR04283 family arsenosugar biosynthesis glycosyltransferase [Botrimarina hoheduenensis]TWT42578.1 Glycosyl transferase family 2 [Botrimarina hoheduenensis]